jgi:hypothetical protein
MDLHRVLLFLYVKTYGICIQKEKYELHARISDEMMIFV